MSDRAIDERRADVVDRIGRVEDDLRGLERTINGKLDKIWLALDKVRDRLPGWAVAVMAIGSAVIGAMAEALLSHIMK